MPARYMEIKKSLVEKGIPEEDAKTQAAKIYNSSRRGDEPELGDPSEYEEKMKGGKRKVTAKVKQ